MAKHFLDLHSDLCEKQRRFADSDVWDEPTQTKFIRRIQHICTALKDPDEREKLTTSNFDIFRDLLTWSISHSSHHYASELEVEIFRCLRNGCAGCKQNQTAIIKHSQLFEMSVLVIQGLQEKLLHSPSLENMNEDMGKALLALRAGIQFLGNLVVGNSNNKTIVWKKFAHNFGILLTLTDANVCQYACMLLYNCIIEQPDVRDELLNLPVAGSSIVPALCDLMVNADSEWCLYTLQNLCGSELFLENCYTELPNSNRLVILDIICDILSRSTKPPPEGQPASQQIKIPAKAIDCLAARFQRKSEIISEFNRHDKQLTKEQENNMDPLEIVKILQVMGEASSHPEHQEHLQANRNLLCLISGFLRSVNAIGKHSAADGDRTYEVMTKLTDFSAVDTTDYGPAYGLKRELVRMIANMTYKHRANQDLLREVDGIPLILDCCRMDAKNPFLVEWVILAVRNACEDNEANQALIASMTEQGFVQPDVLTKIGLKVDRNSEGKPVIRNI